MEKVVPLFKPFNSIHYLKIFYLGKVPFGLVQAWMDLNFIQNCLNFVWIGLNRGTVAEAPPVSNPTPLFWAAMLPTTCTHLHRPHPLALGRCRPATAAKRCAGLPPPPTRSMWHRLYWTPTLLLSYALKVDKARWPPPFWTPPPSPTNPPHRPQPTHHRRPPGSAPPHRVSQKRRLLCHCPPVSVVRQVLWLFFKILCCGSHPSAPFCILYSFGRRSTVGIIRVEASTVVTTPSGERCLRSFTGQIILPLTVPYLHQCSRTKPSPTKTTGAPPVMGNIVTEAVVAPSPVPHRFGELYSPSPCLVPPPRRVQACGEDRMVIQPPPRAWPHRRRGPLLWLDQSAPPKPWSGERPNTVHCLSNF
jgi:hypothetical protein